MKIDMDIQILNDMVNRSIKAVDGLTRMYNYPSNISHLLYLIVPAFIVKYGISNERYILKSFEQIPILIQDKNDQIYQAYYTSVPNLEGGKITTYKGIVLNNYENIDLMQLLDNLVHEFNHAINSINNELLYDEKEIKVRTGLCYIIYDKNTMKPLRKEESFVVEEIINTKQTELIIDIIHSFYNYEFTNSEINNTLYSIHNSIDKSYQSNAYLLQSLVCRNLMENKTFISTLENLRFKGNVEEVDYWFDNITGIENSFHRLVHILNQTLELQMKLEKNKGIRFMIINKIRSLNSEAMRIVEVFNRNCNYR